MTALRARSTRAPRGTAAMNADVRRWPNDPTIALLVLFDCTSVPTADEVEHITAQTFSGDSSIRSIRTSALFPAPRERFADAGYMVCDRFILLERTIDEVEWVEPVSMTVRREPADTIHIRRLRRGDLKTAEQIDVAAFAEGCSQTAETLRYIAHATPHHRARQALLNGEPVGFAITGIAGSIGYVQRLAVAPVGQRRGVGQALVKDALCWLSRRAAVNALVNTGVDNDRALKLYRSFGFSRRSDELVVMERTR